MEGRNIETGPQEVILDPTDSYILVMKELVPPIPDVLAYQSTDLFICKNSPILVNSCHVLDEFKKGIF